MPCRFPRACRGDGLSSHELRQLRRGSRLRRRRGVRGALPSRRRPRRGGLDARSLRRRGLGRQDLGSRHDGRQRPRRLRALRHEGAQRRGLCPQEKDQAHRRLQRGVRLEMHRALQRSRAYARERVFARCGFPRHLCGKGYFAAAPAFRFRSGALPLLSGRERAEHGVQLLRSASPQHPGDARGKLRPYDARQKAHLSRQERARFYARARRQRHAARALVF